MSAKNLWFIIYTPFYIMILVGFLFGVVQPYFVDITYISHIIFGILISSTFHQYFIAKRIDFWDGSEQNKYETFYKTQDWFIDIILTLGFLGAILGIIIGFQAFPLDAFSNPQALQKFIQMMMMGFSTELYVLFFSLVSTLWLKVSFYVFDLKLRNR